MSTAESSYPAVMQWHIHASVSNFFQKNVEAPSPISVKTRLWNT
jgi:hypothetical protein